MSRKFSLLIAFCLFATTFVFAQDDAPTYAVTYQRLDGNRVVEGEGAFPDGVVQATVALDGVPLWVVGLVINDAPVWVVAMEDGRVQLVEALADDTTEISGMAIPLGELAPGQPPLVEVSAFGFPALVTVGADASPFTHPAPLAGGFVYVAGNGDLVLWRDGAEVGRINGFNAQPDTRIVVNDAGVAALYTGATNRYAHAIMGDDLEGSALALLQPDGEGGVDAKTIATLPGNDVFEGISPFWADVDGDGADDLVTTVSNSEGGAWLRVYDTDGAILAEGSAIGRGFRWRHQLAWGAFAEDESYLADVLTPHIGGVAELFALEGDALERVISRSGYTSHLIGSPNLDMGLAADLNGDGVLELVLTTQQRNTIAALQFDGDRLEETWSAPLDGRLSTNLTAVALPDGGVALAAGTDAGALRVWRP